MMSVDNNLPSATNDRLRKAKNAWMLLRTTFVANTNIPEKYRPIISHAIIGSTLRYSLNLFALGKTNYPSCQSWYSKCISEIAIGITKFDPDQTRKTNERIRIDNNISNVQRSLRYVKIDRYYTWKRTLSISYLNQREIDEFLTNSHYYFKTIKELFIPPYGKTTLLRSGIRNVFPYTNISPNQTKHLQIATTA